MKRGGLTWLFRLSLAAAITGLFAPSEATAIVTPINRQACICASGDISAPAVEPVAVTPQTATASILSYDASDVCGNDPVNICDPLGLKFFGTATDAMGQGVEDAGTWASMRYGWGAGFAVRLIGRPMAGVLSSVDSLVLAPIERGVTTTPSIETLQSIPVVGPMIGGLASSYGSAIGLPTSENVWGAVADTAGTALSLLLPVRARLEVSAIGTAPGTETASTGTPRAQTVVKSQPTTAPARQSGTLHPATQAPLSRIFEGVRTRQGFSGIYDPKTGGVILKPSTYEYPVPEGSVPARGGHLQISQEIGRDVNHVGFTVFLEGDGSLSVEWLSRGVNGPNPTFNGAIVPAEMRPTILKAIEAATGRMAR